MKSKTKVYDVKNYQGLEEKAKIEEKLVRDGFYKITTLNGEIILVRSFWDRFFSVFVVIELTADEAFVQVRVHGSHDMLDLVFFELERVMEYESVNEM